MREAIQNKMNEKVESYNQGIANYNTFVPSPSGGPQTPDEMLQEKLDAVKATLDEFTEAIKLEHPPGIKIK